MKRIPEAITALILAVLSCIVMLNVILRYGFASSILSVDELSRYLFVWLTFIGVIIVSIENNHVRVNFLVEKLSASQRRYLQLFSHLIIILLCALLMAGGWQKTLQDWNDHSPILGIPVGLMYAAILPACIIIAGLESYRLVQLLRRPINRKNTEKPS